MPKTTKQQTRSQELIESVDQFTRDHHAWVANVNRPHPDKAYWDSLAELFDVWRAGDVPSDCRDLLPCIDALETQLEIFDVESATNGSIQPNGDFWRARQALEDARKRRELPKKHRESVAELARQQVPHEQIAAMWGITQGQVMQELQQPGSVIGPDFVHPEDRPKSRDGQDSGPAPYDPADDQDLGTPRPKRREQKQTCQESPRELWALGQGPDATPLSPQQAADMLGWTVEQVEAEWRKYDEEVKETMRRQAAGEVHQTRHGSGPIQPPTPTPEQPDEFAGKSDDDLKAEMTELGVAIRGNATRQTMIKKIQAARQRQEAGA